MEKMIKSYGKEFNEIKKMAEDYQVMIQQTGNVNEEFRNKMEARVKQCMFEPKKAARLSYLEGLDTITEEQQKEIVELRTEQKLFEEVFIAPTLKEDIKAIIGEDYTISRLRREKIRIVNGKKTVMDMNYLPKSIQMFDDPLNNAGRDEVTVPTSVFRLQVLEDEAEGTGEKMLVLAFLSLCFDPYKKYYETHHWRVYFKVIKKDDVLKLKETAEVSSEDDLL